MAYVRRKKVGGKEYFQAVRSYREGNSVRQEFLCYLGKSPSMEEAIEKEESNLLLQQREIERSFQKAETKKRSLLERYEELNGVIPPWPDTYKRYWELYHEDKDLHFDLSSTGPKEGSSRWHREYQLVLAILDYYRPLRSAEAAQRRALRHQDELRKLLRIQESYF